MSTTWSQFGKRILPTYLAMFKVKLSKKREGKRKLVRRRKK